VHIEQWVHIEGQGHIEGQVHIEWLVHIEWQVQVEWLVQGEQWAQVQCHIVVDGNGIKGDGGGCRTVGNGDGAEWRSWVLWWVWAHWMVGTCRVAPLGGGDGCAALWLFFRMGQGGTIVKFYTITTKMLVMRD